MPASVAQLDVRPTGDQEIAGFTTAGFATFSGGDLNMKYFLWPFSPSADSKYAVDSFWRKNVHSTG